MRTVLCAAADKAEYISVLSNDLHHFHFLDQVRHIAVAAVI